MKGKIILPFLFLLSLTSIHSGPKTDGLVIYNIEAIFGETFFREKGACVAYTIKNTSNNTYVRIRILIEYFDKYGKVFFETRRLALASDSYFSNDPPLKPNYSFKSKMLCETDGIELDRWSEGKVRITIVETETEAEYLERKRVQKENLEKLKNMAEKLKEI